MPAVVVFLNSAVLSVSDKYDSVNEHTQEISKLTKLHIQGVWPIADKFIRQLPHVAVYCTCLQLSFLTTF